MTILKKLRDDVCGSMLIETAFVLPTLVMMSVAGIEVSSIIVRQHELQSAVSRSAEILMADPPGSSEEITAKAGEIETYLKTATGLGTRDTDGQATYIKVAKRYRCGNSSSYQTDKSGCTSGANVSTFIVIAIADEYTPIWAKLGWAEPMDYRILRTVQVS